MLGGAAAGMMAAPRAQAGAVAPRPSSAGSPRSDDGFDSTPAGARHHTFLSSDGVSLHYLEAGQPRDGAPDLVLVPGWSMPAWIWAPQIAHFAATHRIIAFDPRGQGRSAVAEGGYTHARRAADIAELVQAAQVRQAVLVGWSLGVLECLQALSPAARPDLRPLVRGLVLVDNSVGEGPPPEAPRKNRPSFAQRLRKNRRATVDGFVRSMFKTPQPAAWLAELTEAALRLPLQASIGLLGQPTPREFWRDTLYALDMPVLYVNTPRFARQGALAQARRSSIESLVFEDAGHALFVDDASRFNAALAGFMQRLPAPGSTPR
jgi:microsomal epoxide hydrolase